MTSSDYSIRAESLSKFYRLGERRQSAGFFSSLARAFSGNSKLDQDAANVYCALRDVSFEVGVGEIVGIIGRNGAGKSTLLKILSRIARPTSGKAYCRGRLASLLEVGTGFHPDLTGRENIFLNGAILGMRHHETLRRFDEIVAFSGVEKFLDTPVKRYSSGMYVRLAFSVAAHLEPEILIVDEVLAVGDGAFQKRCLNKMESVQEQGRTVIFVSHSMTAVTRLCPRAILLDGGQVVADGPASEVVKKYLQGETGSVSIAEFANLETAPGNDIARLREVRVVSDSSVTESVDIRKSVRIEMRYQVLQGGHLLVPNLHFYHEDGVCAFITNESMGAWRGVAKEPGDYLSCVTIPGNFLSEGTYTVNAVLSTMDPVTIHFDEQEVVAFQVVDSIDGDSVRGDYFGAYPGAVRPQLDWKTDLVSF